MKIAAVIDSPITSGGGFSQSASAVRQILRLAGGRHEARVYTTVAANLEPLRELGIAAAPLRWAPTDMLVSYAARHGGLRAVQVWLKVLGRMERALLRDGIDLVYFVGPTSKGLALQTLPMISTVWDVCHLDMPEFPEVRNFNEFALREDYLAAALPQSVAVLADSRELSDTLVRRYGLDPRRIIAMPFAPGAYLEGGGPDGDHPEPDAPAGGPGDYLFYPAQFWPHKNHVRVIEAVHLLRQANVQQPVVFCGHDHGNLAYLKGVARSLGVEDLVTFLGFVPGPELRQLYLRSRAVVFASYFGPTNLPPLEAWKLQRPLICARHLEGHVGAAAMLFDADSAESLAQAVTRVRQESIATELVAAGARRLRALAEERAAAEQQLQACLDSIERKIRCWHAPGAGAATK